MSVSLSTHVLDVERGRPASGVRVELWQESKPLFEAWDVAGRSFLLLDDTNKVIAGAPPFVRNATDSRRFGPLTLYLFDYDVARHVRLPPA